MDPFKSNKKLKNKPKLFFVQACRGDDEMKSHDRMDAEETYESDGTKVPFDADFLFSCSTV